MGRAMSFLGRTLDARALLLTATARSPAGAREAALAVAGWLRRRWRRALGPAGAAPELERRLGAFRTAGNERFFRALARHLSRFVDHPCVEMYFEFGITTNERGRAMVELVERIAPIGGKRVLDVGCGYAGFLVAFAARGAKVAGIEKDPATLALARVNLAERGVANTIYERDATADASDIHQRFDVITCNDVIEHVVDADALLRNVRSLLAPGGFAVFEIPNGDDARFVLSDGHYQLFGITLLERPDADAYFVIARPGLPNSVYRYLTVDGYRRLFAAHGLTMTMLEETFHGASIESLRSAARELRAQMETRLADVPAGSRALVRERVAEYLTGLERSLGDPSIEPSALLEQYGCAFWRVLARPMDAFAADVASEPLPRLVFLRAAMLSALRQRSCSVSLSADSGLMNV
jgi:2-polyprenyl-3-methyl-5-hydroxy-6-metoxy-1,4-benzoquinol methylase